ncbi:hypothetical protein PM082_004613 [Marasmius tenuissimus]|nr:hypothetical protein PM082_004613 [Marasmius tenuissimus]
MYCIRYPFSGPLFYWSHDPEGGQVIVEENWEEFGIPKLETENWVGSNWYSEDYDFVREHVMSRNHNLDGRDYAQERGLNNIEPFREVEPDSQCKFETLGNPIGLRPTPLSEWLTFLEKIYVTSQRQQEERAKATTRELKNLWSRYGTGSS